MDCRACGKGTMRDVLRNSHPEYRGVRLTIEVVRPVCDDCGASTLPKHVRDKYGSDLKTIMKFIDGELDGEMENV